jgi:hypothetical protein
MSSRSLAAARARRAGEIAPPVSGNRPGTSINSHAAFAQQMPQGYQNNGPSPPGNVRISTAKGQKPQPTQNNAYQQVKQSQQQVQHGLPFSKLSVSDAVGLITLRLGRIEQWVIETEQENKHEDFSTEHSSLPENSRVIDNSVFSSIINRLETVEKKQPETINNEQVIKLSEDVYKLTEQLTRIGDEGVKHNLSISKHNEQLFKFERELIETKDILKTFMIKYDLFLSETNNKFSDYEFALTELEKNFQLTTENNIEQKQTETENENENEEISINEIDAIENSNSIMSVDLKNIIKQELANST